MTDPTHHQPGAQVTDTRQLLTDAALAIRALVNSNERWGLTMLRKNAVAGANQVVGRIEDALAHPIATSDTGGTQRIAALEAALRVAKEALKLEGCQNVADLIDSVVASNCDRCFSPTECAKRGCANVALSHSAAGQSVGGGEAWKLVPLRPTKEMQDAWDTAPFDEDMDAEFRAAYRRMVEAAPQPQRQSAAVERAHREGFKDAATFKSADTASKQGASAAVGEAVTDEQVKRAIGAALGYDWPHIELVSKAELWIAARAVLALAPKP